MKLCNDEILDLEDQESGMDTRITKRLVTEKRIKKEQRQW